MAWLDDIGLGQLWDRISSVFARKTEAGHSLSFDSGTGILSLFAVSNDFLDSENLDSRYPTKDQAAASLEVSGGRLYIKDVNGNYNSPANGINLADASGTSGLTIVAGLGYNDRTKKLWLVDSAGNQVGTPVTLS